MALRILSVTSHAVLALTSYLRSMSRAEIPLAHISSITDSHVRSGTFEPWNTVCVKTLNCLRQAAHFHTRRSLIVPVRVLRDRPFSGFRK